MNIWTQALPYFDDHELACPHCGVIALDIRMAASLPALRCEWGSGLVLNSCCRCLAHNEEVGGHPRSLHTTQMSEAEKERIRTTQREERAGTMAADVRWWDWSEEDQFEFAELAYAMGWSIGLHPSFCHVDRRIEVGLAQHVFEYDAWEGFSRSEVGGA